MHNANSIRNSKPGSTISAKCNLTFVVVFPKYGMKNYILGPTAIYTFSVPGSLCFLAFLHKLTLLIHAHSNLEITKLSFTYIPQGLLSICYMSCTLVTGCPSLHSSWPPSPLPHIYLSSISLQKRNGLPGLSPELGIPQCSKIRYNPSYQEWTKQPSKRKIVPREDKESETHIHSYC